MPDDFFEFNKEWRLVYAERNTLLYTRDQIEPSHEKTLAYELVLANALERINSNPGNPYPYLAFAEANVKLGKLANATNGLSVALTNNPSLRGGPVEQALKLLKNGKELPFTFD